MALETEQSNADIVTALRQRACPAGLPWTADNPQDDHGHTDCWLQHQAANEIERLRRWKAEATEILARWDSVADTIEIGPNQLGLHKSDLVAIELNDLRAQRDGYFAASHEWRDEYRNLHTLVQKWADDAEGAIYNSFEEAVTALRKAVGR